MPNQSKPQPETANAAIESLGLTMTAEFVPYSQSDGAKKSPNLNDLSLNWRITIHHNGRDILTTPYQAGVGHAPSYRNGGGTYADIWKECEKGRKLGLPSNPPIVPPIGTVLYCLASDADAIDHPTFESWASDLGYDTDSRKAEAVYRGCLEIALKFRAALGDGGFQQLRDAFQNF